MDAIETTDASDLYGRFLVLTTKTNRHKLITTLVQLSKDWSRQYRLELDMSPYTQFQSIKVLLPVGLTMTSNTSAYSAHTEQIPEPAPNPWTAFQPEGSAYASRPPMDNPTDTPQPIPPAARKTAPPEVINLTENDPIIQDLRLEMRRQHDALQEFTRLRTVAQTNNASQEHLTEVQQNLSSLRNDIQIMQTQLQITQDQTTSHEDTIQQIMAQMEQNTSDTTTTLLQLQESTSTQGLRLERLVQTSQDATLAAISTLIHDLRNQTNPASANQPPDSPKQNDQT